MRRKYLLLLLTSAVTWASAATAAPISISAFDTPYLEDFNTLANAGTTNAALPLGWTLLESGASSRANQQYAGTDGSDNAGDVYSFGSSGNTERAFGTLLSGTLTPTIGASFLNNAGGVLTGLTLSYTGEQWRLGVANRSAADRLDFQYSLDATSLTTGTWIDVDALDFSSPVTTGTAGARDGNTTANRTTSSAAIAGLSVANGATFWIRWSEFDIPGADDGLAVDDFSLTAQNSSPVPEPGSLALFGIAIACLAALRRRKQ